MSIFKADCPHCGTRSVAFTIQHQNQVNPSRARWDTFAVCGRCGRGVVASFITPSLHSPIVHSKNGGSLEEALRDFFPSTPSLEAPNHTPSNVARFFKQGVDNLPGNWDAAGSMFRKTLDIGLKEKFPEIEGRLIDRIDKAAELQGLTPDLAEWAHQIRLDGNYAAHEEEPSPEVIAKRLHVFTDLVLRYLFTLPGMLEEARDHAEDETREDGEPSSVTGVL